MPRPDSWLVAACGGHAFIRQLANANDAGKITRVKIFWKDDFECDKKWKY